jgi:hypothetical protein
MTVPVVLAATADRAEHQDLLGARGASVDCAAHRRIAVAHAGARPGEVGRQSERLQPLAEAPRNARCRSE